MAAQAAQRALLARDRAFEILEAQSGPVEAPPVALLQAGDGEGWVWNRYRAVTEDATLSPRQRAKLIAGVVHQDLQLAEVGMSAADEATRRKALRVATIANLYAGMLHDDPRLPAALYEGFLLPNVALAPAKGWGNAPSLLEGASVAFKLSGRANSRRETLLQLLHLQYGAGNTAGADMARVHLADALEAEAQYGAAIEFLQGVTTPDLLGAKSRIYQLSLKLAQQKAQKNKAIEQTQGTGATAPTGKPANPAPAGATGGGNGAGGLAGGLPGLGMGGGPPAQRLARAGRAGTQANGAPGEGEAAEDESEIMRRMRLATEAAQKAQQESKRAGELTTIALAKMLDASDAQSALEEAEAEAGRAPKRLQPTAAGTTKPDLLALRRTAQTTQREASEAAGDAKRASIAAKDASEEAARLALAVFITEPDAAPAQDETQDETAPAMPQPAAQPAAPQPEAPAL